MFSLLNGLSIEIPSIPSFVDFLILNYVDLPETPQNLTAVNLTSRSFTLTWVEPYDNNATIQGYMYVSSVPLMLMNFAHKHIKHHFSILTLAGSVRSGLQIYVTFAV